MGKLILHLCADEGTDSKPYADAGYDVRLVGIQEDVRKLKPIKGVHGVIANPPCTHLAGSGARWWASKGETALLEALSVSDACLRFIWTSRPQWWVLENPVGRLSQYLGKPKYTYQPYEYGDPYTKRTCLWGEFNMPPKTNIVEPALGSKMHLMPPSEHRARLRSQCSPGFAQAFFEANP